MLVRSLGTSALAAGLMPGLSPMQAVRGQTPPVAQETPSSCIEVQLTDEKRREIKALTRTARITDLFDSQVAGPGATIARIQLNDIVSAAARKCASLSKMPAKRISAEVPVTIAMYAYFAAMEDPNLAGPQFTATIQAVQDLDKALLQRIARNKASAADWAAVNAIYDRLDGASKTPQAREAFGHVVRGNAYYADQAQLADWGGLSAPAVPGYIGIGFSPVTADIQAALGLSDSNGEIVTRIEPGGPAARGGVRAGDVIAGVDGQKVTGDPPLPAMIGSKAPGSRITLDVIRDGARLQIPIELGTRPTDAEATKRGVTPAPVAAAAPVRAPVRPATNFVRPEGYVAGSCTFKELPELGLNGIYTGRIARDAQYAVTIFDHPDWTNKAVEAQIILTFMPDRPYTGFHLSGVSFRFAASGYDLPGVVQLYGTTVGKVDILLDGAPTPFKVVPNPQHGMIFGMVELKDKAEVRQFLDLLARSRTLTLAAIAANNKPLARWTLDISSFAKAEDVLRRSEGRCE